MAKEPRTKISGKEARYILKQANVNLSWLAEQILEQLHQKEDASAPSE